MALYVRPRVVCALSGLAYRTVIRELKRMEIETKTRPGSMLKFYNLCQIAEVMGRTWPNETIAMAIARHDKPAAIEN